ncbi:MAG TPA: AAA family ATPase [Aurantimonas sp.]|jgi:cellulose biosynthesis protein BcsQ|nr:AAA family ATPase [Aurantimonas sp.]
MTLAHPFASERALKIGLSQSKGGVGKSTAAINLAGAAAQVGDRVLLIDADPQKSVLSWHRRGGSIATVEMTPKAVPNGISQYAASYDMIVVDMAGADSAEQTLIIEAVDAVLCPLDNPWLATAPAVNSLIRARARGKPARIFLSRIHTAASESRLTRVRGLIEIFVENEWKRREWDRSDAVIMNSIIRDRVPVADAIGVGKTVFETKAAAMSATEYKALLLEVRALLIREKVKS